MAEVDIGGEFYWSYAELEEADRYMNGLFGPEADAWREASEEDRSRGLVTGTRFIDAQEWRGEKTDPDQPGAFPRTGIPGLDPLVIPAAVVQTSILLAGWFLEGSAAQNAANVASGTRRLKAGSVEIEYFRGGLSIAGSSPYPPFFLQALGAWLAGRGSGLTGAKATGTCGRSAFKRGFKPSEAY